MLLSLLEMMWHHKFLWVPTNTEWSSHYAAHTYTVTTRISCQLKKKLKINPYIKSNQKNRTLPNTQVFGVLPPKWMIGWLKPCILLGRGESVEHIVQAQWERETYSIWSTVCFYWGTQDNTWTQDLQKYGRFVPRCYFSLQNKIWDK